MIDIFLLYPGRLIESPYYVNLIKYCPRNCRFINARYLKVEYPIREFYRIKKLKSLLRKIAKIGIPSISYAREVNSSLIHAAHCIPLNKKPWVVDFEYVWSLAANLGNKTNRMHKIIIKKFLSSKYCRKIMPWTNTAKITLEKWYSCIFKEKTEVIYPAMPFISYKKRKKDKFSLAFISRSFYGKGGMIAVEVFRELLKKYDCVEAKVISNTPEKIRKSTRYERINFIEPLPRKEITHSILPNTNILIYPGFSDSFGFIFLEAMNFGIPIITVDGFARKEIVSEDVGFVVKRPKNISIETVTKNERKIINEMIEKTIQLIENVSLRKSMGKAGKMKIFKGKFSIKERNKKLKRIYEEASK